MSFIAKIISENRITLDPKEMKKQNLSLGDNILIDIKKIDHEKFKENNCRLS